MPPEVADADRPPRERRRCMPVIDSAPRRRWRCRRDRRRQQRPAPSNTSVLPASTDSAVAPAARIASIVATPTTGTSNRMSWFGFATFTMRTPGPASRPARRDHLVGAFHRLDGDHRGVLDRDGLPDVEAGDRVGHAVAEREIRAARLATAPRAVSTPGAASSGVSSAVESISSMPWSRSTSATAEISASVFRALQPREHREQRQVRARCPRRSSRA